MLNLEPCKQLYSMYVVIIVIMLFVNFNKSSSLYFPSKYVFHFFLFINQWNISRKQDESPIHRWYRFSHIPDSPRCHQNQSRGVRGAPSSSPWLIKDNIDFYRGCCVYTNFRTRSGCCHIWTNQRPDTGDQGPITAWLSFDSSSTALKEYWEVTSPLLSIYPE